MKIDEVRNKTNREHICYKKEDNFRLYVDADGIYIINNENGYYVDFTDKSAITLRDLLCKLYGKPEEKK